MDYQNRVNAKKGGGGVADTAETNAHRRERLKQLMLSQIDIENDPYVFKNHLGLLECKLCLTSHVSEASFFSHVQGRKHQTNLQKRAAMEAKYTNVDPITGLPLYNNSHNSQLSINKIPKKRNFVKIGRPAYKVTKIRDPTTYQMGLLFQVKFADLKNGIVPKYRLMSAFEQNIDPPDANFQYLVISGEPYENIAFKILSKELDRDNGRFWDFFDHDTKEYFVQIFYKEL